MSEARPGEPRPQDAAEPGSLVAVVMGSDSDWPVMSAAADILRDFQVGFDVNVISAHRMPHEMIDWGAAAAGRGLRVIVAGAGGAAHLPGMLAAVTTLPVIGVPVPLAQLDGLDSLLSIVQMPTGVPVATVGIGKAANAALLAVRILAVGEGERATRLGGALERHARRLRDESSTKGRRLRETAEPADRAAVGG